MLDLVPYSAARLDLVRTGPLAVIDQPALFEITGPGAVSCVQGVVSHDVAQPGPGSTGYGAMLSAKGMIVVDLWTVRLEDSLWLIVDRAARENTGAALKRLLPPRLAKVTDRSDDSAVGWLLGSATVAALPVLARPGQAAAVTLGAGPAVIARGGPTGWFQGAVVGSRAVIAAIGDELAGTGVQLGDGNDLRAAKVMAGFPSLGAEISDRTLPQEVDFDRLGGVSYTKGCFVGQETVARLHFRGHPNWLLRRATATTPITGEEVRQKDKVIGRLGTMLQLDDGRTSGLAVIRREIEPGAPDLSVTIAPSDSPL